MNRNNKKEKIMKNILKLTLLALGLLVPFYGNAMENVELKVKEKKPKKEKKQEKEQGSYYGKDFLKACKQGDLNEVSRLLETDPKLVHVRKNGDEQGKTALHFVAKNGHIEIAKLLLEKGANPSAESKNGKGSVTTPVKRVVCKCNYNEDEMLELLVKHGAQVPEELLQKLNQQSPIFKTFVKHCKENNLEGINNLFGQEGFDINMQDYAGKTLLTHAVLCGNVEAVGLLAKQKGIDLNLAPERTLKTPLMRAVSRGSVDIVKCLLVAGADITKKDYKGKDALKLVEKQIKTLSENDTMRQQFAAVLEVLKKHQV